MNIDILLQPHIQQFITEHTDDDVANLLLKAHLYPGLPMQDIARQIQARQKAKHKLPLWYTRPGIVFPQVLSMEQSSSDQTAVLKASLVQGTRLVDLTGGFGVDSFYFAASFTHIDYVEQQCELADIARHNATVLGRHNITFHCQQAETFLSYLTSKVDCIYLDPARRDTGNRKIVLLEDCEPNVVALLPQLLEKARTVLIKTSPMLDIDLAVQQLVHVQRVVVVAVENECKEVLYLLGHAPARESLHIDTINILKDNSQQRFAFERNAENDLQPGYALPGQFLYEPNAAILKAGAFKSVAVRLGVSKLHRHTHLYTSEQVVSGFPGRIFRVKAVCKYDRKELATHIPGGQANITTRNFPEQVAQIRKKTGLREGGDIYLFATTDKEDRKVMLITSKYNRQP